MNKKCTLCQYFDPKLCPYVAAHGHVDKFGNRYVDDNYLADEERLMNVFVALIHALRDQ